MLLSAHRPSRRAVALLGTAAAALGLALGATSPALAAPASAPEAASTSVDAAGPKLILPEAKTSRALAPTTGNELFSLSTDHLEIEAALGYRATGTVTVTAKRDIRFGNQGEPSVTPEYGARFTGVCPPYFGTTLMHAGDQCTLEYTFAPQSHYWLGAAWNMRATAVDVSGAPEGDPVDAQVAINGVPKVLETTPVDAGSVPVGATSGPLEFRVTNATAFDLPVLAIDSWGSPVRLADPSSLPRTLAPGESANIPVSFSPASAGEQSGIFFVSAHPPVPDWAPDRPASFIANYSGTGVELPLAATDADFGSVEEGSAVERTVTVTNPTGSWVHLTAELRDTDGESDLAIGAFDPYLAPGERVEVPVTWTPKNGRDARAALGSILFTDQWSSSTPQNSAVSRLSGSIAPVDPPVEPTDPPKPTAPAAPAKTTAAANGDRTHPAVVQGSTDSRLATTGAPELWAPLVLAAAGAILLGGASLAWVARKRRTVRDEAS